MSNVTLSIEVQRYIYYRSLTLHAGRSQEEVAKILGISQQTLSDIEKKHSLPVSAKVAETGKTPPANLRIDVQRYITFLPTS